MRSIILPLLLGLLATGPALADVAQGPWILTTDYGNFGGIQAMDAGAPWAITDELATVPGDAICRWHQGQLYVVGRGGSNLIQIYDPAAGMQLVREFSIGSGRNPQDIVFGPDGSGWVSCYDEAVLLKVDAEQGTILTTMDTSAWADVDGLPETAWMTIHEGRLYLTCQLLDRGNWYSPTGPGLLLVVDLETEQWLDPIALTGSNPYTPIQASGDGHLLVGCAGLWVTADGGIEKINPDTGTSEGFVLTEGELGGDILDFVLNGDGVLHALISDSSFATRVKRAQYPDVVVLPVVATTGYDLADVAWDGESLIYVADRTPANPGIRVFDAISGTELTSQPVATELPPFQFILAGAGGESSAPLVFAGNLELGAPYPNPCNPAADLDLEGHAGAQVKVSVFDLRGHLVDRTMIRCDNEGRAVYRFRGQNRTGANLAAGAYRVVAETAGGFSARTVTLVK